MRTLTFLPGRSGCLAGCMLLALVADAQQRERQVTYPKSGVTVGQAWDSIRGEALPERCLEDSAIPPIQDTGGTTYGSVRRLFDHESIFRSLRVNSHGKFKIGEIGFDSDKTFFEDAIKKHTHLILLGEITVERGAEHLAVARLDPRQRQLIDANQLTEFRARCGDSYVYAIHRGGRLRVVHDFHTRTRRERENIDYKGEMDYAYFKGGPTVNSAFKKYRHEQRLKTHFFDEGGTIIFPQTPEEAEAIIRDFPLRVAEDPKPLWVAVRAYPGVPITDDLETYDDAISLSLRLRSLATTVFAIAFEIEREPDSYWLRDSQANDSSGEVTLQSLRELYTSIQEKSQQLSAHVARCIEIGKTRCEMPAGFSLRMEYEYRAQLPVMRNSFDEDSRRGEKQTSVDTAHERVQKKIRQVAARDEVLGRRLSDIVARKHSDGLAQILKEKRLRDVTNREDRREIDAYVRRYWLLSADYSTYLRASWLPAMLRERIETWVKEPLSTRQKEYMRAADLSLEEVAAIRAGVCGLNGVKCE